MMPYWKETAVRCLAGLAIASVTLTGILSVAAVAQEGRIEGLALSSDKPIQIESDKLQASICHGSIDIWDLRF